MRYLETHYRQRLSLSLKDSLLRRYTSRDFDQYQGSDMHSIKRTITSDIDAVINFYIKYALNIFFAMLSLVIILLIILKMNLYLTIFALSMIVVSFVMTKLIAEKINKLAHYYRNQEEKFTSTIATILGSWQEVKIHQLEEAKDRFIQQEWKKVAPLILKKARYQFLHGAIMTFNLMFITRMNLYFLGGIFVIKYGVSVATILVFMNYYEQIYNKVQILLNAFVSLSSDRVEIDRVLSLLEDRGENDQGHDDAILVCDSLNGNRMLINQLCYSTQISHTHILTNITLSIDLKRSLAIVGKSGSGKTTFAKVLAGLIKPSSGSIIIEMAGKDVSRSLNSMVNMIFQDPFFFNLSILENLRLAKPDASLEAIIEVCRHVNLHSSIVEFSEGYDSVIGEAGRILSAGQRHRLAIARALLIDAPIMIFDEPTAALDGENERIIVDLIMRLSLNKTVMVISHRLSTIAMLNDMLIINKGRVSRYDTLESLMDSHIVKGLFEKESKDAYKWD